MNKSRDVNQLFKEWVVVDKNGNLIRTTDVKKDKVICACCGDLAWVLFKVPTDRFTPSQLLEQVKIITGISFRFPTYDDYCHLGHDFQKLNLEISQLDGAIDFFKEQEVNDMTSYVKNSSLSVRNVRLVWDLE